MKVKQKEARKRETRLGEERNKRKVTLWQGGETLLRKEPALEERKGEEMEKRGDGQTANTFSPCLLCARHTVKTGRIH